MFGLFKKDPARKLEGEYRKLLEQALQAQRRGDIRSYSDLSTKADAIAKQLDQLNASND